MDLAAFDFDLPEERIALRPADPKDSARLLVVRGGELIDAHVRDLPEFLKPSDVMVFNTTRVLPAALKGVRPARDETGRDVEVDINLITPLGPDQWRALARPARRLKPGDPIHITERFQAHVEAIEAGEITLHFNAAGEALRNLIHQHGYMPLPPYIARRRPADDDDRHDYQTRFAAGEAASVAAPTASLHFTDTLMQALDGHGIERHTVRLDVGLGTFAPLTEDQIATSTLHEEHRSVSAETASALNEARAKDRRVISVGTTALRTLESSLNETGAFIPSDGPTDIFLKPGDTLRATDALMTNFHLPRSSLFMLVCALMGIDTMQRAYTHAVEKGYRFYSYGDACLLIPERSL